MHRRASPALGLYVIGQRASARPKTAWNGVRLVQTQALASIPTLNSLFTQPPPPSTVTAHGTIRAIRIFKKVAFVDIADGSSHHTLNVVVLEPALLALLGLKIGQSVRATGAWTACTKGTQSHELRVEVPEGIRVLGNVPDDYPLQKKFHTPAYLRKELPTLRFKTNKQASVLRLRSCVEAELSQFFAAHDFVKTHPPLITSSDCEGAGELFRVESVARKAFFGKAAYLTVSTQLHLEALCMALSRVWTLSPCFRAETSNTTRHLSEFWMLEAEVAYVESVHEVTSVAQQMLQHVARALVRASGPGSARDLELSRFDLQEVAVMRSRWAMLAQDDWPSITYTQAVAILAARHAVEPFAFPPVWGDSLQTEHEKWLAGLHFGGPVFVTGYPKAMKPFYMRVEDPLLPEALQTVACFDLLVPEIGELIGGSMREHDHDALQREVQRLGMAEADVAWYTDLRKNGTVPHGGFGMGFERLLCFLGNVENIRDVNYTPWEAPALNVVEGFELQLHVLKGVDSKPPR